MGTIQTTTNLPGNLPTEAQLWRAIADFAAAVHRLATWRAGTPGVSPASSAGQAWAPANVLSMAPAAGYLTAGEVSLSDVINELLSVKARAEKSDDYLQQLRFCYIPFARGRAMRPIHTITVKEIEAWLDSLGMRPRTIKGRLQYLRMLFRFAQRRGYIGQNPALAVEMPAPDPPRIGIHTPDQVKSILAAARQQSDGVARALAVRYFAGLRSAELQRLDQSEILHDRGKIVITAQKSKTRQRRLITIQPNLVEWLKLCEDWPGDLEKRISKVWQKAKIDWPQNVTRHSFVSYHLAKFENAGKTALEAGHSEQMLFAHYRDLVTPEDAEKYWQIYPE